MTLVLRLHGLLVEFRDLEVAWLRVQKVGRLVRRPLVTSSGVDFLPGSKDRG